MPTIYYSFFKSIFDFKLAGSVPSSFTIYMIAKVMSTHHFLFKGGGKACGGKK